MTEPATIELPTVTISEPHRLASGKWRVQIHCSDKPTITYQKFGATADEALSKAREAKERHLGQFLKSLAAVYARAAGRLRQARNARCRPAMAEA